MSVQLELNEKGRGKFFIEEEGKIIGRMDIGVYGKNLIAYHTEVDPELQGKGLSKQLLDTMVAYARSHQLKVIALCPYVHAQFTRHEEMYEDIWEKSIRPTGHS